MNAINMKERISKLEEEIVYHNSLYRRGNSVLSDNDYDGMIEELKTLDPNNKLLFEVGNNEISQNKEKLPIKMGSLNKISSLEDVNKWFIYRKIPFNTKLILTPKFDGMSFLEDFNSKKCFTRGNGIFGMNISKHCLHILRNNENSDLDYGIVDHFLIPRNPYIIGECIIKKNIFEEKYKDIYSNPRNMVASLFNKKEIDKDILNDVSVFRYGLKDENGLDFCDKRTQLLILNKVSKISVPYYEVTISELFNSPNLFNYLYDSWSNEYEIDGIVVDINDYKLRNKLGVESNGLNPIYARAYKKDWEEVKETKIIGVKWQVGKTGVLTPVAQLEPIILEGATVTNVSLYNAKYVFDNKICIGDIVKVKRSGGVISKIVEFVKQNATEDFLNQRSFLASKYRVPSINLEWDDTNTNFYLKHPNDEQKIQQLVYFFKTINVEDFGEPTIRKFYNAGYDNIFKILNMQIEDMYTIDGIGHITAEYLFESFNDFISKKIPFAKLADASCCFDGLAEKTLELIEYELPLNSENKVEFDTNDCSYLNNIQGIGEKTKIAYLRGMPKFIEFILNNNINHPIIRRKSNLNSINLNVVFTGFRDIELSYQIEKLGGKVLSSISSNVTHLIVKEKTSKSSKIQKAENLNIPILSIDEFIDFLKTF